MLKAALDALGAGLRCFDLATLVVAVPLATAIRGWLADRPWATSMDALVAAVVLALALIVGARLGWRSLAAATQVASRRADRAAPIQRRVEHRPAAEPARSVEAASAPAPGAEEARTSARVLDGLRSCMDEVSYVRGNPNVLSMTKYLRGGCCGRVAEISAEGAGDRARGHGEALSFSRSDDGDRTMLAIVGVLDAVTATELRPTIEALVAERRTSIVVDLSALRLIDSSGVGLVVSLFKRCSAFGGVVQVSGLKDQPLAIFRLLRLDRVFTLS